MSFEPTNRVYEQGVRAIEHTPADSDITTPGAVLYCGTGGSVKVTTVSGNAVTFTNVPNGTFLPVQIKRLWATGTDASSGFILIY
jgi:hypothetical protein